MFIYTHTCSLVKYEHTCQVVLSKKKLCAWQLVNTELLTLDSPVLCRTGCWGTVSLLALCPMLRVLSPVACWALPLPRPKAGEENLKSPRSPLARHKAPVSQGCTDCSFTSFSLSHLSSLALPLPSSLCYLVCLSLSLFLPPSFTSEHKHTHSFSSQVPPFLDLLTS